MITARTWNMTHLEEGLWEHYKCCYQNLSNPTFRPRRSPIESWCMSPSMRIAMEFIEIGAQVVFDGGILRVRETAQGNFTIKVSMGDRAFLVKTNMSFFASPRITLIDASSGIPRRVGECHLAAEKIKWLYGLNEDEE